MAAPTLPPEHVPNWADVVALLTRWFQANAPGSIPEGTIQIPLVKKPTLVLPFDVETVLVVPKSAAWTPPEDDYRPFVPSPFQKAILEALEGKALRTDALGAAVGDRGRLYKTNGLKELLERGIVEHHKRLGYYRPDAPPPELQEASQDTPGGTTNGRPAEEVRR